IISTADTWMKISTGELDGAKSLMKGLYKIEGDMNLLINMNKIFSEKEKSDTGSEDISVESQKILEK
ncbi:MAG: SCP2 sterol-binding domain-containing protein, partial [Candidatus Lokiarchaeota archaeon]|nr:SCP2 sterol-binding domain-containing protein [Candidatus Lokiarchaeota archaeon]